MVKPSLFFLTGFLLVLAGTAGALDAPAAEKEGPVLYGDGGGRLWKWESGERTWLTAEGLDAVLGGVGEKQLWGWALDRDRVRFFTLELPKKKDGKASAQGAQAEKPEKPAPQPVFDRETWPAPDRADRVDDRLLLVYGALSGSPRYEVWQKGRPLASRAWDDGRVVYALALGRDAGWILAGRTADGSPWLEVSGKEVPAPEGWRGRLTVAAWVAEAEKKDPPGASAGPAAKSSPAADPQSTAKKAPPPVHPWAAGWGAPGSESPRALFWGPEGWTQPAPSDPAAGPEAGVYPILGQEGGQGTLVLGGWAAGPADGLTRPWFWDGEAGSVPGAPADGEPQALSFGGKGGAFLVVRHRTAPWFTVEDGLESVPLEGLDEGDRVVAVEAASAEKTP